MPKAYLIAQIRVHDPEGYDRFRQMSGPAIGQYGGTILVRNPSPDIREGTGTGTTILIEFASMAAARAFYTSPEYTAARAVRELAAETDLMLVEGI